MIFLTKSYQVCITWYVTVFSQEISKQIEDQDVIFAEEKNKLEAVVKEVRYSQSITI